MVAFLAQRARINQEGNEQSQPGMQKMSYSEKPMEYNRSGQPTRTQESAYVPLGDIANNEGLKTDLQAMIDRHSGKIGG